MAQTLQNKHLRALECRGIRVARREVVVRRTHVDADCRNVDVYKCRQQARNLGGLGAIHALRGGGMPTAPVHISNCSDRRVRAGRKFRNPNDWGCCCCRCCWRSEKLPSGEGLSAAGRTGLSKQADRYIRTRGIGLCLDFRCLSNNCYMLAEMAHHPPRSRRSSPIYGSVY